MFNSRKIIDAGQYGVKKFGSYRSMMNQSVCAVAGPNNRLLGHHIIKLLTARLIVRQNVTKVLSLKIIDLLRLSLYLPYCVLLCVLNAPFAVPKEWKCCTIHFSLHINVSWILSMVMWCEKGRCFFMNFQFLC